MVKRGRVNRYTEVDKSAAVEMYLNGPNSMQDVAKALGMSWSTLQRWVNLHRVSCPEDKR